MNEALGYIWSIYSHFIHFIFNDMELFTNVTFGWICISCIVFIMLVKSILNLPKGVKFDKREKKGEK